MNYLVRPKNIGELTNKLIIKCTESVLILCESYWRVGNITNCTRRDVRSLYQYYHLYMARCQKCLPILPFVHGGISEISTNITICTWRDIRSLYKYYHLYTARCQTCLQILPTVKIERLLQVNKLFLIRRNYLNKI